VINVKRVEDGGTRGLQRVRFGRKIVPFEVRCVDLIGVARASTGGPNHERRVSASFILFVNEYD
jgi:hypothetical protein